MHGWSDVTRHSATMTGPRHRATCVIVSGGRQTAWMERSSASSAPRCFGSRVRRIGWLELTSWSRAVVVHHMRTYPAALRLAGDAQRWPRTRGGRDGRVVQVAARRADPYRDDERAMTTKGAAPGPWSIVDNRSMNGAWWIEAMHPEGLRVSIAEVRQALRRGRRRQHRRGECRADRRRAHVAGDSESGRRG